jgi:hypothetical protein
LCAYKNEQNFQFPCLLYNPQTASNLPQTFFDSGFFLMSSKKNEEKENFAFFSLSMTVFPKHFSSHFPEVSNRIVNSSNNFISVCWFFDTTHVEFESKSAL